MSTPKYRAKRIRRLPALYELEDGRHVERLTAQHDATDKKAQYVMIRKTNAHHGQIFGYEIYPIPARLAWISYGKDPTLHVNTWYGTERHVGILNR